VSTIAYSLVGDDVLVFLSGNSPPDDAEWQAYAHTVAGIAKQAQERGSTLKFIVFADENGPNAKQRAAFVEQLRGLATRTAVVSSSLLARNIITAFGWLNFSVKGFAPTNLTAAASYLELTQNTIGAVIEKARTLAPSIGGVRCLEVAIRDHRAP